MERRILSPVDFLYNSAAMKMDCTELSISHFLNLNREKTY